MILRPMLPVPTVLPWPRSPSDDQPTQQSEPMKDRAGGQSHSLDGPTMAGPFSQ
jgi:hypothetical protein